MYTYVYVCVYIYTTVLVKPPSNIFELPYPTTSLSSSMALQTQQLHFLLVPLLSQSHIIPLTDFAILLAQRGLTITMITTPVNAIRSEPTILQAQKLNLKIHLIPLNFPSKEVGLPDGCENLDSITSQDFISMKKFFLASSMMQKQLENLIEKLEPKPNCIVSTNSVVWTSEVARKFGIPRYVFRTTSCFTLSCSHNIGRAKIRESVETDSESFIVPDVPDKVELTKSQLPTRDSSGMKEIIDQLCEPFGPPHSHGTLVNSFAELETTYVEKCKQFVSNLWCVGPVSLRKNMSDKFGGREGDLDEHDCLNWLDSKHPYSVIYACFGSLSNISPPQMIEICLGLESSDRPFILIIGAQNLSETVKNWLEEEKFEERVKGRGFIIRKWAPQVQILSHPSVGGFLTHCGWNSTLEGICAGVPMITWPMFAEQFFNDNFIVNVLRIGVRVRGEDNKVEMVKREELKEGIDRVMEGELMRKRGRELGEMAKKAVEEGGSSYSNISLLIEHVLQHINPA